MAELCNQSTLYFAEHPVTWDNKLPYCSSLIVQTRFAGILHPKFIQLEHQLVQGFRNIVKSWNLFLKESLFIIYYIIIKNVMI